MPLVMRGRKRRAEPTPSEEPESASASPEPAPQRRRVTPPSEAEEEDDDYGNANNASTHSDQAVKKLVRLALACEYQRRPIRRQEISDKVLGKDGSRTFKNVYAAAQQNLRDVFGMELTILPAKEKMTVQEKRAAAKSQSQGTKPPQQWVLTSILPTQYRDPFILPPLSAPTQEVDATYTAIYSMLIALIMLGGGQIPQAKLERHLRRLGLEDRTPVPGSEKTEKLLKRLEKDGYIREIKEQAMQGETDISYVVGPRGKVEVGRQGVEGLVQAVYDVPQDDEAELRSRVQRSLGVGDVDPPPRATQNEAAKKKRGRPRRDADEEQGGGESEEDEEESD